MSASKEERTLLCLAHTAPQINRDCNDMSTDHKYRLAHAMNLWVREVLVHLWAVTRSMCAYGQSSYMGNDVRQTAHLRALRHVLPLSAGASWPPTATPATPAHPA